MHHHARASLLATMVAGALGGCATVVVDGRHLKEYLWVQDSTTLRAEAGFLFKCPNDQLTLTVLDALGDVGGDIARSVGVRGCGQSAVYKRVGTRWFMEAATKEAPSTPATAAAPE